MKGQLVMGMQVAMTMDGEDGPVRVFMVRHDEKPQWKVNVQQGGESVNVLLNDNQAAATAALAVGGFEESQMALEQELYKLIDNAWDVVGVQMRPIP